MSWTDATGRSNSRIALSAWTALISSISSGRPGSPGPRGLPKKAMLNGDTSTNRLDSTADANDGWPHANSVPRSAM